jgi:general stress protein 26
LLGARDGAALQVVEEEKAMTAHMTETEKRAHLREVVADFDTAMLVTRTTTGDTRARPLALASPDGGVDMLEDGVLYFPTSLSSPKIEEIAADPRVAVTMQDKRRFVSITGTARILSDRQLVDRLWTEAWKVWFPKGKNDPELCLLEVLPTAAEYWDQKGGKGLSYLFEAAKAYVQGNPPETSDEQHAKVRV